MDKKQIAGLVAAAVVFVFVCSSSVLAGNLASTQQHKAPALNGFMSSLEEVSFDLPTSPYVGIVSVEGTIMASSSSSSLFPTEGYDHNRTMKLLDSLEQSPNNKGILLYVNSPGGSVYESDELYQRLLEYKENTGRPIWTYMGSMACSGGYYIAMASDKVIANRNSWTGSIGVIVSLSNYKELMDKLGIKTILFTSGRNKAMGNGGIDMTEEQAEIMQSLVDEPYEQFVGIVAQGRNMDATKVKPLADGRIYTAKQALDAGLIDGVEGYDDALSQFEEAIGEQVEFYAPTNTMLAFSSLFSAAERFTRTEADQLKELMNIQESGVPMYYAILGE